MSLIFRIVNFDSTSSPSIMEYEWSELGGTIGRSASNDWVLPDRSRFLSGKHALIKYQSGKYYITDTSTNGLFVDHNPVPLGKDNSACLKNGDVLKLGEYEIKVLFESEDNNVSLSEATLIESAPETDSQQVKKPIPGGRLTSKQDQDPFGDFDFNDKVNDKLPESSSHLSDDPFFKGGEFTNGDESLLSRNKKEPENQSNDHFLGLSSFFSPSDLKEGNIKNKLTTKHKKRGKANKSKKEIKTNDVSIPIESKDKQTEEDDPFAFLISTPKKENINQKDNDKRKEHNNNFFDTSTIGHSVSASETQHFSTKLSSQDETELCSNPEKREQTTPQKTQSTKININSKEQNMTAFLNGVGLYDKETQQKISQHLEMEKVGKLFRLLLQGSMDVLKTRTEIKNEMRVELTTIQPIENNPVKFSVDVDDALARLFLPANNAFMPAEQAFIETFDDIKIHQVAVLAGVQSSLKHIFRRFNPEKLAIKLEKQNPIGAKIPIHRQAKLWSLFEDLYDTIGEEAADDFQQLFGLEFSRAYEEQIEQLELSLMLKNK